ncbi:MAG TPA: TonB-dependent hemoglobin/transferrin/lactoferrin family receptor, partial [Xanthomonadales bacterium]|nr:TonB-dependent hemoglobin/transferrin/lactoferrin family receptor [Xanthomonadales bacterium]
VAGGRHSTELVATVVERKDDVDQSGAALFEPAGYATLDLYHRYRPNERLRVDVGLFNLADRRYWDWARVRGIAANAHDLDLYTGPGRSAAVTLTVEW